MASTPTFKLRLKILRSQKSIKGGRGWGGRRGPNGLGPLKGKLFLLPPLSQCLTRLSLMFTCLECVLKLNLFRYVPRDIMSTFREVSAKNFVSFAPAIKDSFGCNAAKIIVIFTFCFSWAFSFFIRPST